MEVNIGNVQTQRNDFSLYSESQGRIVVTVAPQNRERFEKIMAGNKYACIGKVTDNNTFLVQNLSGRKIIETTVDQMLVSYKSTFEEF